MDKLLKIYETMIIGLKKYHGSMQERHIGETQTRGNKDIKNEIKTIQKTKLCLKKKGFVISLQYMYIHVHIYVPLIEIKFHTPITTV